ncbi:reverse transcriptase [Senna tora]|uniref:Reverse transcriptase n=1 Tax=Senna tora TaxID=362788 RepID=A0A834T324_9FABA|nr:reverse transcriptase [Senna tora]
MDCDGEMDENLATLVWDDDKGKEIGKHTLIGKLLTNKSLNRGIVRSMIQKGWNIHDGLEISEPWESKKNFHDVELYLSPYWLQFHGVPLDGLNRKNAEILGAKVGRLVAVEDPLKDGKIDLEVIESGLRLNMKNFNTFVTIVAFLVMIAEDKNENKKGKESGMLGDTAVEDMIEVRSINECEVKKAEDIRRVNRRIEFQEANVGKVGKLIKRTDGVKVSDVFERIKKAVHREEDKFVRKGSGEEGVIKCRVESSVEVGLHFEDVRFSTRRSPLKIMAKSPVRNVLDDDNIEEPTINLGYFVEMPEDNKIKENVHLMELITDNKLMTDFEKVSFKRHADDPSSPVMHKKTKMDTLCVNEEIFNSGTGEMLRNKRKGRNRKKDLIGMEEF